MDAPTLETLCVGCLAPCQVPSPLARAAMAGRRPTTIYCNDELAFPGYFMRRPDGVCACGNSGVIIRVPLAPR